MVQQLSPNPGLQPQAGSEQVVDIWITELIRIVNLRAAAIPDLNQTITDPPTQAEVQAISDKVDLILAALRTVGKVEE